jgi:hypothetical protein
MQLMQRRVHVANAYRISVYGIMRLAIVASLMLATVGYSGGLAFSDFLTSADARQPIEPDTDQELGDEEFVEFFFEPQIRARRSGRAFAIARGRLSVALGRRGVGEFRDSIDRPAELSRRNGMGGPLRC